MLLNIALITRNVNIFSYRASHLANDPFVSFPQFPYGSPAEFTRSKQIPGAGFAPVKHTETT